MRASARARGPRRTFLLLAMAAALVGLGGGLGTGVLAQEAAAPTGESLFGSYALEARSLGVQARYEIEGLLPGGSPVIDLTIPETLARFGSGPTGYGLASMAYPGGILVNLPSLVEQSGQDASGIPDYPIKAEGFFPSGPLQQRSQALGDQQVLTNELGVEALGTLPGVDADPVVTVASVRSAARSAIEDGTAVSRSRVVLSGVELLGGVITIEALTTDLVAAHDGAAGSTAGDTLVSGVRFLGLAARLTQDGLVLDEAPDATGPASPLGAALDPLVGPLQEFTAPVREAVTEILGQAVPSLDELLAGAGIRINLLGGEALETDSGASAFRSAGLSLSFTYSGREQDGLRQLIESIPEDLRPNIGPLPNPVAFLTENHITALTLGAGTVSALASPPFETGELGDDVAFDSGTALPDFGGGPASSDFTTPVPELAGPVSGGGTGGIAPGPSDVISAIASGSIPAIALVLLLLAAPFWGLATTRLADNVLAPVSTSCPSGLDQPPAPPREP